MGSRVSVIVTCYNLERYIGAALESVLSQQTDELPEIIVVDDASTDRSSEIVRRFHSVRLVQQSSNGGVLNAMLRGIAESAGDLLFFLDGDDIWSPAKLKSAVASFNRDRSAVLLTHDLFYMNAEGRPLDRETRVERKMRSIAKADWSRTVRDGILSHDDYVWLGSALAIRRSLADLEGFISFANRLPDPNNVYQDWPLAFWCAALPGELSFKFIPQKLFGYRLHAANYSGNARTTLRATRNFRRTANTLDAMEKIARMRALPRETVTRLAMRADHHRWVSSLYEGRSLENVAQYVKLMPHLFRERLFLKDSARFVGTQLLGPSTFNRLLHGRPDEA